MLIPIIALALSAAGVQGNSDVRTDTLAPWARASYDALNRRHIMVGLPDGSAGIGAGPIRRYAACVVLDRLVYSLRLKVDTTRPTHVTALLAALRREPAIIDAFKDVDKQYFQFSIEAIESFRSLGILHGFPDGYFRGKRALTRGDLAVLLAPFLRTDLKLSLNHAAAKFRDAEGSEWWFGAVFVAAGSGVMHGYQDGTFRAKQPVTLDEFIVTIARLVEKLDQAASS